MTKILTSLKEIMLGMSGLQNQHRRICDIAFSDGREKTMMINLFKNSFNLIELHDSCDLLELFYDEKSVTEILRCKPCFQLHIKNKPALASMTPTKAQEFLNYL